ncbi:A24 family peptidase [Moraxella haemolytica]|uniref:prepilin peptidase n=1 Tax=Moraxella TaxID=475 RepID=UPI0025438D23|nr:A24 family peptidase [Moraxella sp. ZY171148]WII95124.1 A24 family peptidase [Moraxella sp. ZY171148]
MDNIKALLSTLLAHQPTLAILVGVIGLVMGRFINIIAHRTPMTMMNQWWHEVMAFIQHDDRIDDTTKARLDSLHLHSHRADSPTHSNHLITAITALLSMMIAHHFGANTQMLLALVFVWYLVALSCIDWQVRLLPDRLLAPLGMIGLLANTAALFTTPVLSIWGLVVGFVVFWGVNVLCRWFIHQDGLGLGDAKLLGVLGAWLGVSAIPIIVLIASLLGVMVGVMGRVFGGRHDSTLAFGPYLAIGGLIAMLFGEQFWAWYLMV